MNSLVKTYGFSEMIDPRLDELYMESAIKVGLLANLIPISNSTAEDGYAENTENIELTVQEDNK